MSYQVLALKYRPQTFDHVIGQENVTTTLKNALVNDRMAHAILFTGPRGTGKTTIARILAKAMNCKAGPTVTPCNTCSLCTDITAGHASDVFEIDGASNNSVDQIRELRENVTYMPSSARYKIYIIDEVHMLSTAAFNALLKTLEEPPDHVLFIFATTEVHKIPATILSRCQRHNLGRIKFDQISRHLQTLSQKEGFAISEESCDVLAIEADGSIRDALSLLDRILSINPDKVISHDDVLKNLGITDKNTMLDISRAVIESDGARLIDLVETIHDSGIDLKRFFSEIITHFRNMTVLKLCGRDTDAVDMSSAFREKLFTMITPLSGAYLNALLQVLLKEETLFNRSSHTRTALEMVLLKLLGLNPGAQIDAIIQKLDLLAKQIDQNLSPGLPAEPENQTVPGSLPPQMEPPSPSPLPDPAAPEPASPKTAPKKKHKEINPDTWPVFLKSIETKLPVVAALLSRGRLTETAGDEIIVTLDACSRFDESRLNTKQAELISLSKKYFNKPIKIDILTDPEATPNGNGNERPEARKKQEAANHPFVARAIKLFNGSIVDIT